MSTVSNPSGAGILAEYYILLGVALILIAARIYVSVRITHIFDWADVTILIATGFLIVGAAFCTIEVELGLGQHLDLLEDPEYSAHQILRWNTFFQIVNVLTTLFTKYSIAFYLLRIWKDKRLKIVLGVMMAMMTAATLAVIIVLGVACIPLRALWDPTVEGKCLPLNTVYIVSYVQSGFTIVIDFGLTLTPAIVLWNVRIQRGRKSFIIFLMSLGLLATISNALRNVYVPTLTSPDFTYAIIPITVLAVLELNSGVIAACIPAVMPLFTQSKRNESSSKTSGSRTFASRGNMSTSANSESSTVLNSRNDDQEYIALEAGGKDRRYSSSINDHSC